MPASHPTQHPSVKPASVRKLLLALGSAMVAGGQPVYDVEDEMRRVAWTLGYHKAQVSASPTSILVALVPGDAAALQIVPPPLRLDQSAVVNDIRRRLLGGELGIGRALAELAHVRDVAPAFGTWGAYVGNPMVSVGICLILQPGLVNILTAAVLSVVVVAMSRVAGRWSALGTLLAPVAAFVVAVATLLLAQAGILEGPLRTIICPLAVLLPGATLATGMAELAGGMMVSGTSRLVYGGTQLMLFTLGVIGAAMALGIPLTTLANVRVSGLGLWGAPLGLVCISLGLVLAESLPLRLMPYALSILLCTFLVQNLGQLSTQVAPVGSFLGAIVASFGASAVEATRPNVSRLVVFLPSFWLLVPGTLGVIGITQLGTNQATVGSLFGVLNIIITIALGLLIGSALARPLYRIARRRRRATVSSSDFGVPISVPATDDPAHD